jgi:uncharacterized membrane protein
MSRKLTVLGIAALVLLAGTAMASTAFTTATVDRNANLNVQTDDTAVVGLTAGNATGGTATDTEGRLLVKFNNVNKNATFSFGDTATPSSTAVFEITNNDGQAHTFNFDVTGIDATFYIENSNGVTTATTSTTGTFDLTAGETAYVAVEFTTGTASQSGTITISV